MEHIFTYPREKFDNGELTSRDIATLINTHIAHRGKMVRNLAYYEGGHDILERIKDGPNAKPVCNHAKDISDIASGYFLGSPVAYKGKDGDEEQVRALVDALKTAGASEADQDNALNGSIFGLSYDYEYEAEGSAELRIKSLSPLETFVVVDDTIEHRELFGVNYFKGYNDVEKTWNDYLSVLVATATERRFYRIKGEEIVEPYRVEPHHLGEVPITEYRNNKYGIGDFEQQIGLIDAYNTLMADRVNDKEQFVDSILVIYGSLLASDTASTDEAMDALKRRKLMELDEDAKAEYLTNTLDESGTETLRKAIKQDIYTFSHVPNLADENFAGNSSGVAMEYKLLGLEMLTKIKENWYRKGLKKRMRIFIRWLAIKDSIYLEENNIEMQFSRALPKNILELSQIIVNLEDKVPDKTLLSLLPFVEDPDAELEALRSQEERTQRNEMEMQGFTRNDLLDTSFK